MPIRITCPGCRKRFQVSDKFAGKKGPCPKCKTEILIPTKGEEVVVHEQESFGPKDTTGRATLKPIFREETKFSPLLATAAGGGVLLLLVMAVIMRISIAEPKEENFPIAILAMGSLLLAALASWGGYSFLQEDELEPYRGKELVIRVAVCTVVYALLWGIYFFLVSYFNLAPSVGKFPLYLVVMIPLMFAAGGGACHFSLDLSFGNGVIHYGFYVAVSVLMRLIVGLSAF